MLPEPLPDTRVTLTLDGWTIRWARPWQVDITGPQRQSYEIGPDGDLLCDAEGTLIPVAVVEAAIRMWREGGNRG